MSGWGTNYGPAPTQAQLDAIQPQPSSSAPAAAASSGNINTAQDLSALGLTGDYTQNSNQQFAYDVLGPQNTSIYGPDGGFQGTQVTPAPTIPNNYGTGLDLSTLQGLDTLAERWSYQDPSAGWVTPGGDVNATLANDINTNLANITPSVAYAPWMQSIIPDPSNGLWTAGADGTVTAAPGNQSTGTLEQQYLSGPGDEGQDTGPPMGAVLGLAGAFLAPFGAALGAGAGALDAGIGATAGDVSTSDLGALTAGAGDAGGTAAAAGGGGIASDLGSTLGLLDPSVQAGIQGADVASAVAGGADPATALTASGLTGLTSNFGDVFGLLPGDVQVGLQGADAASAIAAGGDPALAVGGVGNVIADVSGLGDIANIGGAGAGGAFSTAQGGIDPTAISQDSINLFASQSQDATSQVPDIAGNLTPGNAAYGDTAATLGGDSSQPGFWSDLFSGNFGNLGSDLAGDASTFGGKLAADLSDPLKLLGLGASGIGLGLNLEKAKQSNPIPGMSNIQSTANQLGSEGTQLQSYLNSGTLPQGVQAALNQATQAAIQAVRSNFASRGIGPGSTMEQQQIAAIQQNAAAQGGQLALNLLQQGVQMSQLSAQLYQGLVTTNASLNQQTEQSISNLVAALAGGNNRIVIQGTQAV